MAKPMGCTHAGGGAGGGVRLTAAGLTRRPAPRGQTIHQLQSDVNRHEQAELRRQESGAAPQPMPTAVYQAPPPTDSDEADGGYRRQRDRQFHTQFTPSFMSTRYPSGSKC